ncbi:hypothetical protein OIE66_12220 [Nonomuraea sp. NBC_01738]|uniref:hypothetical protein n=1 Tax=Nonomuraea sp. NBC_01738 TaxID=2976003 RepID=UPI002E16241D|nr:hypothetical protein OIE66_12220 [Nonomuraea sp. NBC_01738]
MAERETGEEFVDEPAGYVGAHEAVVGSPTDPYSINVPPIRPGAEANEEAGELARTPDEVFIAADRDSGGDVLDVSGTDESAALRERAEREDPLEAAKDAMKDDLTGEP